MRRTRDKMKDYVNIDSQSFQLTLQVERFDYLSFFCYFCGTINRRTMTDQIIAFNKTFVAKKGYKTHPLVPKEIVARGFIMDSETGALEEID